MSIDIVGIGYPCLDMVVRIPHLPQSGTAVPIQRYLYQGGGTVSTALVAASSLGASAGIVGLVGDDSAGEFCIRDFQFNKVDVSRLIVDPGSSTAVNICLSESEINQRSFLAYESSFRSLRPEEIDLEYICGAKWLHLARMDEISVMAAEKARANGVKVMLDADLFDERTERFSGLIDALIASEEYYEGRFQSGSLEENCKKICEEGPETAVITLGARGCAAARGGEFYQLPAFRDINVVDTTGAGDVFHGAFLYGLLQQWDLERTARFASAASAIKCTRLGGRTGIPDRRTVERFLLTGEIDTGYLESRESAYSGLKYA